MWGVGAQVGGLFIKAACVCVWVGGGEREVQLHGKQMASLLLGCVGECGHSA
jgi:hypothetical protein